VQLPPAAAKLAGPAAPRHPAAAAAEQRGDDGLLQSPPVNLRPSFAGQVRARDASAAARPLWQHCSGICDRLGKEDRAHLHVALTREAKVAAIHNAGQQPHSGWWPRVADIGMLCLLLLLLLQAASDRSPSIESFAAAECMLALCDPSHFRQR
jgi:hypothetical protein